MRAPRVLGLCALAFFAALFVVAHEPAHGDEAGYTDRQFEHVVRGYLLLGKGDYATATAILYKVGVELGDPLILRDAAQAAITLRDLALARRIGQAWHEAGGGADALRFLTRIQATTKGLESAIGLLSRIAEESGAEDVFLAINDLDGDTANAMRVAHPLHLRTSDYHAYLAILHLGTGNARRALEVLDEGLEIFPDSVRLLLVRIQLAELARDDFGSINYSNKLARASGTDLATSVMVYERWLELSDRGQLVLPQDSDFEDAEDQFSETARLQAGYFYLRHGDPEAAVEVLSTVPRNSPSWGDAISLQVQALRTLDESARIFGLLDAELESASLEFIPTLVVLYAEEIDNAQGPMAAFEFLDSLERGFDDSTVLYSKSLYAENSGLLDEAEAALRAFIKARPDEADGYNALGYLFAHNNIKLDEARTLIERALSIDSESPAIIDSHGWLLYRLGNLDLARLRLEESLKLMGKDPHAEVLAHYGEVLWELGQRELAVRIWKEAWKIDSDDRHLRETLERYAQPEPKGDE